MRVTGHHTEVIGRHILGGPSEMALAGLPPRDVGRTCNASSRLHKQYEPSTNKGYQQQSGMQLLRGILVH